MKFTTKTEYGLICLIYMAKNGPLGMVTVPEIVRKERFSKTFIEKILQSLRKAKIVTSHQGTGGGYVLARDPGKITLKEIIEALEGHTFDVYCSPSLRKEIVCTHYPMCGVLPIWKKTKELIDDYYQSVTLEALAQQASAPIAVHSAAVKTEVKR